MSEIVCPNCKKPFQIDESGYAEIVRQVSNQEFKKQLDNRVAEVESRYKLELSHERSGHEAELKQTKTQLKAESQEETSKLRAQIEGLKSELEAERNKHASESELAVIKATSERDIQIEKLQGRLSNAESQQEQMVSSYEQQLSDLRAQKDSIIRDKDDEIERLRDQKARLSTKMLGETLELHCEAEFNRWRSMVFQNAQFHKDNDASEGSKGDYIYREFDDDGIEIISIMFEMKNEADTTKSKHKNEDFLKKLDSDRTKKNCEYAVLVTLLEPDNEFYNTGIVDLSFHYDKMYAVRPQFFIPIISLLRNSARANLDLRRELFKQQQENIDITNFEQAMEDFKEKFGKNVTSAKKKYDDAIEDIDKAIARLEKVKENLRSSERQLRLADDKAQSLTIRSLTKKSPSVRKKFAQLEDAKAKKEHSKDVLLKEGDAKEGVPSQEK